MRSEDGGEGDAEDETGKNSVMSVCFRGDTCSSLSCSCRDILGPWLASRGEKGLLRAQSCGQRAVGGEGVRSSCREDVGGEEDFGSEGEEEGVSREQGAVRGERGAFFGDTVKGQPEVGVVGVTGISMGGESESVVSSRGRGKRWSVSMESSVEDSAELMA